MKEFRNELIDGIVEVSLETGTPVNKCIEIAIEMLEKEKRKNCKSYSGKEMFRGGNLIKAWRKWRKTTNLSDGTFLKFYIYDRMLIKPRRKAKKWLGR